MDKVTAIGIAALATAGVGTGVYYSRGGVDPDLSTPPYLAQESAKDAFIRLTALELPQGLQPSRREMRAVPEFAVKKDSNVDRDVNWHLTVEGVDYLVIHAALKPVAENHTAIDVTVDMPDSPFRRSPSLHPYDVELIESFVDLAVTDHIQSVFEARRPTDMEELAEEMDRKVAFSPTEKRAMRERLRGALEDAFAPLKAKMEARASSSQNPYYEEQARARARMIDAREAMRRASEPTTSAEPMINTEGR